MSDDGRRRRLGSVELGVYALLTLLVWGLFALERGLFQDDAALLARMRFAASPLLAVGMPTRRLLGLPYWLALRTPAPIESLQLLGGATWLATGLLARRLALQLTTGRRDLAFAAGALTICATSDFLTNSLVALGYELSILALLGALTCGIAWRQGGRAGWLVGSALLLAVSLWTTDVALTALPLAPLVLALAPSRAAVQPRRRIGALLLVGAAAIAPYGVTLIAALRQPSYAAVALVPMPLLARLKRAAKLFLFNFEPWRWAFARPPWYEAPPPALGVPLIAALAAVGTLVFVLVAWRGSRTVARKDDPAGSSLGALVLVCLGLAAVANAAYANVQMSESLYRTQLLSRVWISMALALGAGWLAMRWRGGRTLGVALWTLFVGLGIWGGLERQSFYLASWRAHQGELLSIVETAPELQPDTALVLYVPPHRRYLATEAPYLMHAWAALLYADPSQSGRTYLWAPARPTFGCRPQPDALACRQDRAELAPPWSRVVVLGYDLGDGRFHLLDRLPAELGQTPPAYRPRERIVHRPLGELQRRLLLLGRVAPTGDSR